MTNMSRVKTHPGQTLLRGFIIPYMAGRLDVDTHWLQKICDGEINYWTDDFIAKLVDEFPTTQEYWEDLTSQYMALKKSAASSSAHIEPGRVEIMRDRYEVTVTKICLAKTSVLFCGRQLAEEYLVAMAKKDHVKHVELKTHILNEHP